MKSKMLVCDLTLPAITPYIPLLITPPIQVVNTKQMNRLLVENEEELGDAELSMIETMFDILDVKSEEDRTNFFTDTAFGATWNSMETWEKVKVADEIYAATALIDQLGVNGGLLFNNLMHHTIEAKLTGKKVCLLNDYDSIWWDNLDPALLKQCFGYPGEGKNELYCYNKEHTEFELVDVKLF